MLKLLVLLIVVPALVYGDEVDCALAVASCNAKFSGLSSNSTCEELQPAYTCLVDGGCESSDVSLQGPSTAYDFPRCNFSGAVSNVMCVSLLISMVSLVRYFTQ